MLADIANKLFHISAMSTSHMKYLHKNFQYKEFKARMFCHDKNTRRLLNMASMKLDSSLDLVRLIRAGRKSDTLLRLLLNKNERRWVGF